jgi:GT2 family glycosyltransferase
MQEIKLEAVETVKTRFGGFPLWGFKDPRTARLLPFWRDVFKEFSLAEKYVLIIRNPMSVVRSLKVRNQFAFEKSYLLWLEHSVEAYINTRGMPRVVVDYDVLIARPEEQLHRIAERLALPLNAMVDKEVRDYAKEFLDSGLRHSAFDPIDIARDIHAVDLVSKTYEVLRKVALDQLDGDSIEVQSALLAAKFDLDRFGPVLLSLDLIEEERDSNRSELEEVRDKSTQLIREAIQLREAIVGIESELSWQRAELGKMGDELNRQERQNAVLETDLKRVTQAEAVANTLLLSEVHNLWNSRSWQLMRALRNLVRKRQGLNNEKEPVALSAFEAIQTIVTIRQSVCWELTAPLRLVDRALAWRGQAAPTLPSPSSNQPTQLTHNPTAAPGESSDRQNSPNSTPPAIAYDPNDAKVSTRRFFEVRLKAFLDAGSSLRLPRAERPEVTIILVLYNQAPLTFGCLSSIAECLGMSHVGVEIIIVDNASSDSTGTLLSRIEGATVLRNDTNLNFLKAVNEAALHARGKYLLLLNNDAQLLPGSLEAAVDVLGSSPDVGAVGGRLILPDGTLQEAGSIVWSDGSCVGYGRGDYPSAPPYMFRRDVDYSSGAFLLTRTELFTDLGGFDESFVPAYYEETDYCARLWELGFRVVYEPRAVVLHYEFASSETIGGAIQLQQNHRAVFAERHISKLRRHLSPSPSNVLHARTAGIPRKRILIIEDRVPHPWLGAGFPRSRRIVNELARAALVTFFPSQPVEERLEDVRATLAPEVEVMLGYGMESIEQFLGERRCFYGGILVCRPHNMRLIAEVVRRRPELIEGSTLIYDAEALFAAREILARKLRGNPFDSEVAEAMLEEEASLAQQANLVFSVSQLERAEFKRLGVKRVELLGHAVEPSPGTTSFSDRRDLLFVGRLEEEYSPNVDGIRWFSSEVLPIIQQMAESDVALMLAGLNGALSILDSPALILLGMVENLEPIYNQARVFIAPTRYAAGVPLKVYEAAAHGVPSVVTPLVAEQLGWCDEKDLLVGEDAESFALQCTRLYRDEVLWTRLRENALLRVREDCDPNRFTQTLARIVDATKNGYDTSSQPDELPRILGAQPAALIR